MYKRNINSMTNELENIFDDEKKCFIPLDEKNVDYKKVLQYLQENNLTIDQLDLYQ